MTGTQAPCAACAGDIARRGPVTGSAWGVAVSSALATTKAFNSTGGEQQFVVPPGVTSLNVVAISGEGGNGDGSEGGAGGFGARAVADLKVNPGQLLYIEVGGNGGNGQGGPQRRPGPARPLPTAAASAAGGGGTCDGAGGGGGVPISARPAAPALAPS